MNLYHSGISSPAEYDILCEAGSPHLLADIIDMPSLAGRRDGVWLDSPAYKVKRGRSPGVGLRVYGDYALTRGPFAAVSALDRIGDPEVSHRNWLALHARGIKNLVPVWQWRSAGKSRLREYLDSAPVVGLGGLVDALHAEDEETLDQLSRLCEAFPGRFHVFGLMWLAALQRLAPLLASADTAKWITAAAKHKLIHVNTRNGQLSATPAAALVGTPTIPECLPRRELAVTNARNLTDFCRACGPAQ